MTRAAGSLEAFQENAETVVRILKVLANERRLMILCTLATAGEATPTQLGDAVGLSQSALSQHLSRMRDDGIVAFRRDGLTSWYRISDSRVAKLMKQMEKLFCADRR